MGKLGIKVVPEDEKDILQIYPNDPNDKENYNILKTYSSSFEELINENKLLLNTFILLMIKIKDKHFINKNKEFIFELDQSLLVSNLTLILLDSYKCKKRQIKVLQKTRKFVAEEFNNLKEVYENKYELHILESYILHQIDLFKTHIASFIPSKSGLLYLRIKKYLLCTLIELLTEFDENNPDFLIDKSKPDSLKKFIYINSKFKFMISFISKYLIKVEDDIFDYSTKSKRWKDIFAISDIYVIKNTINITLLN